MQISPEAGFSGSLIWRWFATSDSVIPYVAPTAAFANVSLDTKRQVKKRNTLKIPIGARTPAFLPTSAFRSPATIAPAIADCPPSRNAFWSADVDFHNADADGSAGCSLRRFAKYPLN